MGMVLWANLLKDGDVVGDQNDLVALSKHFGRLDKISKGLGYGPLSAMFDQTDLEVNMEVREMPEHYASTTEFMRDSGTWVALDAAIGQMQALRDHLEAEKPRIGLLFDAREAVLVELDQSLDFARAHLGDGVKFNFAVVM